MANKTSIKEAFMGLVNVGNLREGMILAGDLHAPNGRFILGSTTCLKMAHIQMMKVWGITYADVAGIGDDLRMAEITRLEEEVLRRSEEVIRPYFPPSGLEDEFMAEIFRLCVLRRTRIVSEGLSPEDPPLETSVPMPSRRELSGCTLSPREMVGGEIELVSLPNIYFKIQEVLNAPLSSATHIARVVGKDPSLTMRLLRLVNSSFYGFPSPIHSISRAVAIVGINELTTLALAVSAMTVFGNIPSEYVDVGSFWRHSIACGVFARILAFIKRIPSEERFFLAGLLHDMGRIILYRKASRSMTYSLQLSRHTRVPLVEVERRVLGFDHALVGDLFLTEWNIPEEIRELVKFHHSPLMGDHPDETSILYLADVLANAIRFGSSGSLYLPHAEKEIWEALDVSPSDLEAVLLQGDRQIREIMKIFMIS